VKRGKGKPRIEDKNITIRRFRRFEEHRGTGLEYEEALRKKE